MKSKDLNKEIALKWIKILKSGKYTHGYGRIYHSLNPMFTKLGMLNSYWTFSYNQIADLLEKHYVK